MEHRLETGSGPQSAEGKGVDENGEPGTGGCGPGGSGNAPMHGMNSDGGEAEMTLLSYALLPAPPTMPQV